jgi:TonB family protein
MRQKVITFLTLTFIFCAGVAARAQTTKPADDTSNPPATDHQSTPPAAKTDDEQPNEVDQMVAEARKRGETVVGTCIDPFCGDTYTLIEGLDKGHAVALPKPAYPPLARAAHAAGTVEVRVLIDYDGKVIAAAASSGHPLLYSVCVKAARAAEFTPTKLNGQPVKVTGVIQYNFVAQ